MLHIYVNWFFLPTMPGLPGIYIYNYIAYICESVLSSHHVGHRGQSRVIRWGSAVTCWAIAELAHCCHLAMLFNI